MKAKSTKRSSISRMLKSLGLGVTLLGLDYLIPNATATDYVPTIRHKPAPVTIGGWSYVDENGNRIWAPKTIIPGEVSQEDTRRKHVQFTDQGPKRMTRVKSTNRIEYASKNPNSQTPVELKTASIIPVPTHKSSEVKEPQMYKGTNDNSSNSIRHISPAFVNTKPVNYEIVRPNEDVKSSVRYVAPNQSTSIKLTPFATIPNTPQEGNGDGEKTRSATRQTKHDERYTAEKAREAAAIANDARLRNFFEKADEMKRTNDITKVFGQALKESGMLKPSKKENKVLQYATPDLSKEDIVALTLLSNTNKPQEKAEVNVAYEPLPPEKASFQRIFGKTMLSALEQAVDSEYNASNGIDLKGLSSCVERNVAIGKNGVYEIKEKLVTRINGKFASNDQYKSELRLRMGIATDEDIEYAQNKKEKLSTSTREYTTKSGEKKIATQYRINGQFVKETEYREAQFAQAANRNLYKFEGNLTEKAYELKQAA